MKSGRTTPRNTPASHDREERLKLAIASGRVGVWEYNLVSGELIWDDMMYDLYGMNPGEFGRSYQAWLERLHPEDRAGVEAAMEEALQGARDFSQEFRILWPNGETHHIKGHAQTVRNAAGKPIRLIGTTWDNQAYAQAQALLQHAFIAINKSKTAFFWVEPGGRVTDANDYACQSLGYSHEELVRLHIWDFDPDFPPEAVQAGWEAVKVDGIRIFETRHRRRDGSIFPVEITANYINFNGVEQTFCSVQNIAERKKIESALRLTQFVVDHSSVEVYRIDPAGHILYANEQACRGLDYTIEEMTKLTIPDIDAVVQQVEWEEHWRDLRAHGSLFIETLHRRRDGSVRPVEVSANYFNYDGEEFNFAFVRDISERKQADQQIRRLTHLYKALTEVFQAIVRKEQATELFPLVCRCAVEFGGMKMAWVGQLDPQSGAIHPVASHGGWKDYLAEIRVSASAEVPEGNGPAGTALRENHTVIVNDFLTDPMTRPWQALAAKFGWGAAASFPIQHLGQPFAVLTVYHEQANAFDTEAITLLDVMSAEIAFALDNHEREMQRQAALDFLRLAASVYDTSSEAMMFTDADNRIISINPAFTTITGYSAEEAIGNTPRMLKSDRHDPTFYAAMWSEILNTGHWQGEIWDRRRNGEVYLKWLTVNTVFKANGAVQHRIALFTDITQKKASEKLIWKQANFDDLTELPNRHMFHDRLRQEIMKAHRSSQRLALLFIDLDRFKEINDTLGHAMGDSLLKEAARRLVSCIRESDTVARMGGDEFTVILGELDDPRVAERVAQDILQRLAQPFQMSDEAAYVSASIGITLYPEDATDIEDLVKNADQAMYAAKNQGRNRYQYFTPSMQQLAQQRMRLATDLRAALAGGQFWVAYQPIVDLASGTIRKAEALLRWEHPQRGLVSPAEFIPIAEDTGLITEIGDWVFREAARQVLQWRQRYHPEFQISVNKSPVQFYNTGAQHLDWQDHLKQLGLSGQSLAVEITEGLLLDASGEVVSSLLQFRDAGMQVAIDDFGTGYSSLAYLKKFDIDYLKIDQSFVRGLARDSNDMALCEAIVVMAHKLGIEVIAEGVETEEQKALLLEAGCDYAQGFLFSRPVRAAELEPLLAALSAPSPLPAEAVP